MLVQYVEDFQNYVETHSKVTSRGKGEWNLDKTWLRRLVISVLRNIGRSCEASLYLTAPNFGAGRPSSRLCHEQMTGRLGKRA
jgi:hypothetical protein